jgi:hypothetical protein
MRYLLLIFILPLFLNQLSAQKMFEEQFSNCPLKFILEDTEPIIDYETGDSLMVVDFLAGLDEKQEQKLKGVVMMQIMIDTVQQLCCVSYTNKTTLSNKRFDIPNRLQTMSNWKRIPDYLPEINICALISIVFDKTEITVIRTGYNRNKGRKILQTNTFRRYPEPPKPPMQNQASEQDSLKTNDLK